MKFLNIFFSMFVICFWNHAQTSNVESSSEAYTLFPKCKEVLMKEDQTFSMGQSMQRTDTLESKIDQLINNNVERFVNGVVLVANEDQVLYKKACGSFGNPMISNQFIIGSISKQFTAALILNLVDRSLLEIDQPIKKYLPDLTDDWTAVITIKHLLNHTSGIKALGQPLEFKPGTQFKYSSTLAYYLSAKIAENVTGKRFETLLNELLKSAGLQNVSIVKSVDLEENRRIYPNLIKGFKESRRGTVDEVLSMGEDGQIYDQTWNPGGGIIATAYSLLQWNLALHCGKLLSENSYKLMTTPSSSREHPRYGTIGYGFGVQIVDRDGYLEISHSGYIDGYVTTVIYYPACRLSVVILENISWNLSNVKRVFSFHDHLRNLIRTEVTAQKTSMK